MCKEMVKREGVEGSDLRRERRSDRWTVRERERGREGVAMMIRRELSSRRDRQE